MFGKCFKNYCCMLCNVFGFCYNSIMPSDDLEWMVNHTGYNEQDVKLLCLGNHLLKFNQIPICLLFSEEI